MGAGYAVSPPPAATEADAVEIMGVRVAVAATAGQTAAAGMVGAAPMGVEGLQAAGGGAAAAGSSGASGAFGSGARTHQPQGPDLEAAITAGTQVCQMGK
mgnify:CR=1 FL=1